MLLGCLFVCIQISAQTFIFSPSFSGNSSEYGGGITVYDINNDGWDDVSIPNAGDSVHTYINNQGVFEYHHFFAQNGDGRQIVFGDYDNDGDADAAIATSGGYPSLYEQVGNLEFIDVSYKLNPADLEPSFMSGITFGDVNGDGLLDIYLTNYFYTAESRCYLFINDGEGGFEESAEDYGILSENRYIFNSVIADFNQDHQLDIWNGNDRIHREQLFLNSGSNFFNDIAPEEEIPFIINTMSVSPHDYDHDGDLDVYLSNSEQGNCLLQNQEDSEYENVAANTPLAVNRFCWGALWIDLNGDMWTDLLVGTRENYLMYQTRDAVLINNQGGFTNQELAYGFNAINGTYAFAKGDFNRDFRSDFTTLHDGNTQNEYVLNSYTQNRAVEVTLEGTSCNRDAFGSMIHYYVNGQHLTEAHFNSYGYNSQNSQHILLSCGMNARIDSLQVVWPSGDSEWWYNLPRQQRFHLKQGEGNLVFTGWSTNEVICPGETVQLSLPEGLIGLWSNGAFGNSISFDQPGDYFATINGAVTNVVSVQVDQNLLNDYTLTPISCYGQADAQVDFNLSLLGTVLVNGVSTTLPLQNLASGEYAVQWISPMGCSFQQTVEIVDPAPIALQLENAEMVCDESSLSELVLSNVQNATAPCTISLNGSFASTMWEELSTSLAVTLQGYGSFELLMTDANGCTYEGSFEILAAPPMTITLTQLSGGENNEFNMSGTVSGGLPPFQWIWSNGDSFPETSFASAGSISCMVVDALGCKAEVQWEITGVEQVSELEIRRIGNDFYSSRMIQNIRIFDETGKSIIALTNMNQWSLNGMANGVYICVIDHNQVIKVIKHDE
jgi:hypothetical protein